MNLLILRVRAVGTIRGRCRLDGMYPFEAAGRGLRGSRFGLKRVVSWRIPPGSGGVRMRLRLWLGYGSPTRRTATDRSSLSSTGVRFTADSTPWVESSWIGAAIRRHREDAA